VRTVIPRDVSSAYVGWATAGEGARAVGEHYQCLSAVPRSACFVRQKSSNFLRIPVVLVSERTEEQDKSGAA
jgi:hypothetical protein